MPNRSILIPSFYPVWFGVKSGPTRFQVVLIANLHDLSMSIKKVDPSYRLYNLTIIDPKVQFPSGPPPSSK
jgi:hypothetical protein